MSKKEIQCPVETTLTIIDGRWRGLILRELLFQGTRRFSELHRALVGISHRILTQELRALEGYGIVHREIFQQVPPKVEYSMTRMGETLKPLLLAMNAWGREYEQWAKAGTAARS